MKRGVVKRCVSFCYKHRLTLLNNVMFLIFGKIGQPFFLLFKKFVVNLRSNHQIL